MHIHQFFYMSIYMTTVIQKEPHKPESVIKKTELQIGPIGKLLINTQLLKRKGNLMLMLIQSIDVARF